MYKKLTSLALLTAIGCFLVGLFLMETIQSKVNKSLQQKQEIQSLEIHNQSEAVSVDNNANSEDNLKKSLPPDFDNEITWLMNVHNRIRERDEKATNSIQHIDTSEWRTFINVANNYSIQYPAGSSIYTPVNMVENNKYISVPAAQSPRVDILLASHDRGFRIFVAPNPKKLSLINWINKHRHNEEDVISFNADSLVYETEIKINKQNGYKLYMWDGDSIKENIILTHETSVYVMSYNILDPSDNLDEQTYTTYRGILKTFAFTN